MSNSHPHRERILHFAHEAGLDSVDLVLVNKTMGIWNLVGRGVVYSGGLPLWSQPAVWDVARWLGIWSGCGGNGYAQVDPGAFQEPTTPFPAKVSQLGPRKKDREPPLR